MDGLDARKQELELEKSVRRLREKFHGKIPVKTAVLLMKQFANNHDLACRRIILCMDTLNDVDPDEQQDLEMDKVAMNVINKIKEDDEVSKDLMNNKDIKDLAEKLKALPLTMKNLKMFNNASKNYIASEDKQFACVQCDKMWWRRVPQRKEVSRCHRCRRKYDPVPVDKMWGLAEFQCLSCNRTFKGLGQMGIPSPCYTCNIPVLPSCILPPQRPQGPRTRNPHSCYAEDCYNRREPHVPGLHCVHPKSRSRNRLPKVLQPSLLHVSSGSTVATCLSQGSLIECDLDDLIMDDIAETDEEESDGSD
ncbi:shiftless antiviral inhibitor of ribosomal frameshifting protein isoform X1 [Bombina bombina]|uniref:shiftless antiviral inhibitor of ribosomal frameshifting protein isoform X1 n=1 Tax=Bombina bombina TaxID=8345 RepID=UPI00235AC7E2|nr:shiftless antiviral inhibitor of ribosomal frameshifting protein isoform X1 [Bombina bombina]